jgi:hypothetical protein
VTEPPQLVSEETPDRRSAASSAIARLLKAMSPRYEGKPTSPLNGHRASSCSAPPSSSAKRPRCTSPTGSPSNLPRGEIWARHTDILDHVPWPPNEHAGLLTAASTAITAVSELRQRLVRNDIHHVQHDDMADRARAFGDHLRSAVRLAQDDSYPSSFALLRVALEHQLLDTLIFRGRRYVRIFTDVTERRWQELQAEREAGAQWAQDIVDWYWTRRGQRLTVTYRGMFSEPDENGVRTEISVYYVLRTEFDPLAPRPGNSEIGRGFPLITEEEQTQQAEQNRSLYELYLRWPRIKRNLLSNMFETEESLAQLDVHYRFLSAHVHPLADRSSDTYGRNRSWPSYDH